MNPEKRRQMDKANNSGRRSLVPGLIAALLIILLLIFFAETWMRHLLLYLSAAGWARRIVSSFPVAQRVARRFVAGETIADAVRITRELNAKGMHVTLNYLGESVSNTYEAMDARDEILRLLARIHEEGLDANVSVKPSQLGLDIDPLLALDNLRLLLERAQALDNWIRIDMEESAVVDTTLDIYRTLRYKYGFDNVGVVIQSYLYRSEGDVRELIDDGASVRLCKGAYMEPSHIAFPDKHKTDQNFILLTHLLLSEEARQNSVHLALATHDEQMIDAGIQFAEANNIARDEFEIQMLYGVRRELQESLAGQGYQVRIYTGYGSAWYPYFVRRLAERPANLWFFISNFIRR
jgi:proline dehydrogenase